jgi:hypothetical protein
MWLWRGALWLVEGVVTWLWGHTNTAISLGCPSDTLYTDIGVYHSAPPSFKAHPGCPLVLEFFSIAQSVRGMKLTAPCYVVPALRTNGVIPPSCYMFMSYRLINHRDNLPFHWEMSELANRFSQRKIYFLHTLTNFLLLSDLRFIRADKKIRPFYHTESYENQTDAPHSSSY